MNNFLPVPEPPTDVQLTNSTSSSLSVAWKPPTVKNGVILHYNIIYETEDSEKFTMTSQDTAATIKGLLGCSAYTISIRAVTGAGKSNRSDRIEGTTNIEGEFKLNLK